ncbi:DUF6252 family protein [Rufibacter roseus]|uniref:DUF6252 family protein n=1 Tax=Rufibacter roseus TaxID=1567108 RepID=A0ABW2DDU2_9BACT|nr:DUF6252 family protein [Rufibacter roseus]
MKKLFCSLLPVILFFLTACEKEEELPEPTQTGAGIMAARINGKPWQHNSAGGTLGGGSIQVNYYTNGYLHIFGQRQDDYYDNNITLSLSKVTHTGEYTLEEKVTNSYGTLNDYTSNSRSYQTTASTTGTVTITKLDTHSKIISGTFSFRAQNRYDPAEFVEVTEGRFDVRYE